MGLAAPKNRIKLSHDPNNTKWTNDKSSFGHRIMSSQGWQPGDHLGVKGAAHAEFHTDANFSHIRVAIKDDNLGLGAKIGSGVGPGECTGLDAFQNLLGRLNGRDEEEMEREQKSREDLKRAIYAEQKWGTIRFVKGGLLVGDKIQPLIDAEAERVRKLKVEDNSSDPSDSSDSSSESEDDSKRVDETTSKKRKLIEFVEPAAEVVAIKVKKSKKRKLDQGTGEDVKSKKSKKSKSKSGSSVASEDDAAKSNEEVQRPKKKSKKDKRSKTASDETQDDDDDERTRRKQEKDDSKREKRERKEKARAEEKSGRESKSKSKRDKKKDKGDTRLDLDSSQPVTKESTPIIADSSGRSTPIMQGRHAVRARNIAQKRLASMDVASLNQIFMIKS